MTPQGGSVMHSCASLSWATNDSAAMLAVSLAGGRMLDVHAPHDRMEGWRDFLLHLLTITIGLLIALSLEGLVDWQHHRHLVHEAETNLHGEIVRNAQALGSIRQQVKDENQVLDDDLKSVRMLQADPRRRDAHFSITFRIGYFDDLSWKTAQSTGAAAYMPYGDAQVFSDIYEIQDEVSTIQKQAVSDGMQAASLVSSKSNEQVPTPALLEQFQERIGLTQLRLILVTSYLDALDKKYKDYLAAHPEHA